MKNFENIKKLHKISTVLLSQKQPEKVLYAIVKNAAEYFSADACSILLFDDKKEYLHIAHSYNLSKEYADVVKVRYDEDIAGKVASSQKPVIISDIVKLFKEKGDKISVMWFKKEGLVSCVDAPVVLGKTSIGCLNLYYRKKYTFRERDLDVLRIFCDFSAIAIHNAGLIKKIEMQLKERSALEKVRIALSSTLKLSDVLKLFISTAIDLTDTKMGSIILIDEKEKKIEKAFNYDKKKGKLESYKSTARLIKGVSGTVLKTKRPVAVNDLSKKNNVNPAALEKNRRGVLAVPVIRQKKIIAILYVDSSKPRDFSTREISQLSFLASQAAVAIENARLYTQVEQKIRDLSISYKISQTLISSTLDLETLLTKILEELKDTFGYLNIAILLIDTSSDKLYFKAAMGYPQKVKEMRLKIGKEGITGHVAATGKTYYVHDVSKEKRYIVGIPSAKSEVAIPLKIGERTIGVLDVESEEFDAFDEWEIKLLSSIAAQIANAIEKSRLYEKTKTLSLTDPLTSLPNGRHFDIMIDNELKRSERYNRVLSLLLIDLDNFKQFNDKEGHVAGDRVLTEYATIMKSAIRDIDFICRYGGDEFVVVLPETDESFAKGVGERLRKKTNKEGELPEITLSIGVASYPSDGETKEGLIMASDKACYTAKGDGGNCVRVSSHLK
jgi:diguanylate cyclase (GGDEF)-like protein